jgi:cytochrome P450
MADIGIDARQGEGDTGSGYDPFAPSTLAEPADAHRALRTGCPVHRFDGFEPPFFTLSRHDDIVAALRDHERWSSVGGQGPATSPTVGMFNDPPEHTMFRRMVLAAFTPRVVERMEQPVRALTASLLDDMRAGGPTGDLHDGLAMPLPVITIARILGVAEDLLPTFKVWSDAQVAAMGRGDRSGAESRAAMNDYFVRQLADRRGRLANDQPLPDDLVSGLVVAANDAPRAITDEDLLSVLVQLLVGGNETTTSLITNCVWRLLQQRELWDAVCEDPVRLAEVAVEESLRFDAPVLGLFRTTTAPVELHGVEVPDRAKVMLLFASANRDEQAWDDPDSFRLDRDLAQLRRQQLAFGAGVHFCLGAPLARLEAKVAIELLATALPGLRLDGEPERIEPFLLWGKRTMPVRWD